MLELRPYQKEAIDAVYRHLREHEDNPCVVIPTAGGKTPILATICKDAVSKWRGRVLIVAHVKELLEQAVDKLNQVAPELGLQIGIYSAGLKSHDTDEPIIVAGIQSIYKRAKKLGHFDLAIIDEVHCIPPDGDGMYRTLLTGLKETNPILRIIGLTATPYRMASGDICAPENILNTVCY
jgi:DNA repair protein RadD